MSHLKVFRRHPKRTLTGLVAVLAAVAVAVGSGADFTSSSSNTGNSVQAGTLKLNNGTAGSVLTVAGLKPGGTAQTSTVDIENGGNLAANVSLYRGTITDSGNTDPGTNPFSKVVDLVVTDCGPVATANCSTGTQKYKGTLDGLSSDSTKPVALGSYAAADKRRYQFAVSLASTVGNAYQAGKSVVDLNWAAIQS